MKSVLATHPSTIDCTRCHKPIDARTAGWCDRGNLVCDLCGCCTCHAPAQEVARFLRMASAEVAARWQAVRRAMEELAGDANHTAA